MLRVKMIITTYSLQAGHHDSYVLLTNSIVDPGVCHQLIAF